MHVLFLFPARLISDVPFIVSTTKMSVAAQTISAAQPGAPDTRGSVGAYKDFQIHKINKDVELHGTDKFKAASFPHYLPTWENEKNVK